MYFKYFKDAKKYADRYYKSYSIRFCNEKNMLYVVGVAK